MSAKCQKRTLQPLAAVESQRDRGFQESKLCTWAREARVLFLPAVPDLVGKRQQDNE